MTELRRTHDRFVNLGKDAVVPHTRVRFIRTMGTFFSALVAKTTIVVCVRDTLGANDYRLD